ncbi:PTS cellobiose transporter subunit IIC [Streptococcaceae bacterium ESL0729]|nr:PTS cellobiose transporter subunit IIC [Streptococcaceae bacterium ESL0729]
MNKFMSFLENHFMKPMGKVAQYKFVRAIMAAGLATIPFTIVGSMFLVLNILPTAFPALEGFFDNTFFRFSDLYMIANTSTMGILSLYFALVMGYELTKIEAQEAKLDVSPINGALLSMFAFFMCLPELIFSDGKLTLIEVVTEDEKVIQGVRMAGTIERLGTTGIFTAIIMAVVATQIYFLCIRKNWIIKMPDTVPAGVSRSFTALIPAFAVAFAVLLINGVLVLAGTDIFKVIAIPFGFVAHITNSWWGLMIIYFLIHALWILGIHGANIINPFIMPFLLTNMAANVNGAHLPFAGEFQNSFVVLGGSGATLGMVIFIAFFAKSEQLKVLGRASVVPGFFNINEPIIFGMPVVYNPYLAVPFFLAPMASATIAYFSIKWELVSPVIAQTPWPTPVGIGGFLSTADWRAVILALVTTFVAFLIWLPFVKIYDNKLVQDEKGNA